MTTATIVHGRPRANGHDASLSLTLASGDAGTEQTIAAMRAMIHDAARNSQELYTFTRSVAQGDSRDPIRIYHALRRFVKFKPDAPGIEHLRHPDILIEQINRREIPEVDCDDRAMLGAAMLLVLGYKPVLIVIGKTPDGPYEHVLFGYRLPDGPAYPLDPQEGPAPGVMHPQARRVKVFDV